MIKPVGIPKSQQNNITQFFNLTSRRKTSEILQPQEKNNGFPFLDILGYLKNAHKRPKFGKVRQIPTREFPTKFPDWDLSHFVKKLPLFHQIFFV